MKATFRPVILVIPLLIFLTSTALAQIAPDPGLVYLRAAVTNRDGRSITGLPKEAFKLTEDNKPQEILSLSGDVSFSVALLIDVADNVRDEMKATALSGLLKSNVSPDKVLIADFGKIPLNESLYQTLERVVQTRKDVVRAVVLLTARSDPGAYSYSKIKQFLKDQDVAFYAVGITEAVLVPISASGSSSQNNGRELLRDLAELSGGNSFFPSSVRSLESIYSRIGTELRHQYLIGYRPVNTAQDGKWRKIKVTSELFDPKTKKTTRFQVRTRSGYYAPTAADTK